MSKIAQPVKLWQYFFSEIRPIFLPKLCTLQCQLCEFKSLFHWPVGHRRVKYLLEGSSLYGMFDMMRESHG
uniref:Uncharacterized protein n=1 Tax=Arundo donax TaxID=35708 RepID=A0A0A9B999_ARUDO